MPKAGDGVTVVTSFVAGGGYVCADDIVFWALGDPAIPVRAGNRCTLTAVDVVDGVPVGRIGEPSAADVAVVDQ